MSIDMGRVLRIGATLAIVFAGLVGCARIPLAPPQPSMANIEALRGTQLAPVALGEFTLGPGKSPSLDKSLDVRTNTVHSPYGDSFSLYLREVLLTELRSAGKLDTASPAVVSAMLTNSVLEAGPSVGRGTLAATFTVRRDGRLVYERAFSEQAEWPSSVIGAIAIPAAVDGYTALFKKLVGQLVRDPAFGTATSSGR